MGTLYEDSVMCRTSTEWVVMLAAYTYEPMLFIKCILCYKLKEAHTRD